MLMWVVVVVLSTRLTSTWQQLLCSSSRSRTSRCWIFHFIFLMNLWFCLRAFCLYLKISNLFLSINPIWKKTQLLLYWLCSILCWCSTRLPTCLWENKCTDFSLIISDVHFDHFERVSGLIHDCTEFSTRYWYQHASLGNQVLVFVVACALGISSKQKR